MMLPVFAFAPRPGLGMVTGTVKTATKRDEETMKEAEVQRAVRAAKSTVSALGLGADDAVVLHDSNRLTVRVLPCDLVARIAPTAYQASAEFEVEVARRLAGTDGPAAALEPRVEPRAYVRDDFVINLWTYYEPVSPQEIAPAEYAQALERLLLAKAHHCGATTKFCRENKKPPRIPGANSNITTEPGNQLLAKSASNACFNSSAVTMPAHCFTITPCPSSSVKCGRKRKFTAFNSSLVAASSISKYVNFTRFQ